MNEWRADRIGTALRGENPTVLARLPASFAVIGDVQWLPGYSVLLVDDPEITRLSELSTTARAGFLSSMARLADAVESACAAADPAFLRVNIEILGNTDPYLHAHIFPRYSWEPDALRKRPVWLYPESHWQNPAMRLQPHHEGLRTAIAAHLRASTP